MRVWLLLCLLGLAFCQFQIDLGEPHVLYRVDPSKDSAISIMEEVNKIIEIDLPCDLVDKGQSWYLDYLYHTVNGPWECVGWSNVWESQEFYYYKVEFDSDERSDLGFIGLDWDFPQDGYLLTTESNTDGWQDLNDWRRELQDLISGDITERDDSIFTKDTK